MTAWASPYIGIPFLDGGRDRTGLDCWGLVRLVLQRETGLSLPGYDGIAAMDARAVRDEIAASAQTADWIAVDPSAVRRFDVIVLRGRISNGSWPVAAETHVGIAVNEKQMMHVEQGTNTVMVPFKSPIIRDRIRRVFRHRALA